MNESNKPDLSDFQTVEMVLNKMILFYLQQEDTKINNDFLESLKCISNVFNSLVVEIKELRIENNYYHERLKTLDKFMGVH